MSAQLAAALVTPLLSLRDARDRAADALDFVASLPKNTVATRGVHEVWATTHNGAPLFLRPVNTRLFIPSRADYLQEFVEFEALLAELSAARAPLSPAREAQVRKSCLISRVLYTTQQAVGCSMDCLVTANTARKNYGSRFEELMRELLATLGIGQRAIQFSLPYKNAAGETVKFTNQVDLVIAEQPTVQSRPDFLDPAEVVVSLKTSSKDRFSKIFLDQEMLSFVTGRSIKVVALFHNDIQRQGATGTSWTFVAGNFAAYVARFGPLTGVYYVDPPDHINREPWSTHLRTYEDLLLSDFWSRIF